MFRSSCQLDRAEALILESLIKFRRNVMSISFVHLPPAIVYSVPSKRELDRSLVMAWVGSPAQSQMSLFLKYPFPRISVVMSLKKLGRTSHA